MKRFFAFLLAFAVLFALCACSEKPLPETAPPPETDDSSLLSATELYARAVQNQAALLSAQLHSEITLSLTAADGAAETVQTVTEEIKTRSGFDNYGYSRTDSVRTGEIVSERGVYYSDGAAVVLSEGGNFSAPATVSVFQDYVGTYTVRLCAIDLSVFGSVEREENTVRYSALSEGKSFELSPLLPSGFSDYSIGEMKGDAQINAEGLITAENMKISGSVSMGGSERAFTIQIATELLLYNDSAIRAASAPEDSVLTEINDIRLPAVFSRGLSLLKNSEQFNASVIGSETMQNQEQTYEFYTDSRINKVSSDTDTVFSIQQTDLYRAGQNTVSKTYYQTFAQGGAVRRTSHDLISGKLLSDEVQNDASPAEMSRIWQEYLFEMFPQNTDFTTLSLTEDSRSYQIQFTLSQTAVSRYTLCVLTDLLGGGASLNGVVPQAAGFLGSITVAKDSGALTGIAFSYGSDFAVGEKPVHVTMSYSFTVNSFSGVTPEPIAEPLPEPAEPVA